jgi:hypothetical protein
MTKKVLVVVGLLIALGALLGSVFAGINTYHVLTLTDMNPSVALFQSFIAGAFSFVVYAFIGIVGSIVFLVFYGFGRGLLGGGSKPAGVDAPGKDAGSDSK